MAESTCVRLSVNGESMTLELESHELLADVLRDRLAFTSVRETCGVGICGTCTVLVDGIPISSCLTLAIRLVGSEITTAEGLFLEDNNNAVRRAFTETEAFQCSYCTPGMAVMVSAYVESEHSEKIELDDYLVGNLCRCGSYYRVREAASLAAKYRSRDRSEKG